VRPRISELADWLARGYRASSAGTFLASLFGGAALLALLNDVAERRGPIWGSVFGISILGLAIIGTMAVLGYRDPGSPWQLARRYRRLSERALRFAEEMFADRSADFELPPTPPPGTPITDEFHDRWMEWTQRTGDVARYKQGVWERAYLSRLGGQLGCLIEDTKDEGYALPPTLHVVAFRAVNDAYVNELARELAVMSERLAARRGWSEAD
jgi:hypothetical protein